MAVQEYKPIYSAKEVSKILQVSINTVYQLMNQGKLPYLILGSKKIRGSDLERFIEMYPSEKESLSHSDGKAMRFNREAADV